MLSHNFEPSKLISGGLVGIYSLGTKDLGSPGLGLVVGVLDWVFGILDWWLGSWIGGWVSGLVVGCLGWWLGVWIH